MDKQIVQHRADKIVELCKSALTAKGLDLETLAVRWGQMLTIRTLDLHMPREKASEIIDGLKKRIDDVKREEGVRPGTGWGNS